MLKTFSIGGVHPHENKLSAHQPIITAEVPGTANAATAGAVPEPASTATAASTAGMQ